MPQWTWIGRELVSCWHHWFDSGSVMNHYFVITEYYNHLAQSSANGDMKLLHCLMVFCLGLWSVNITISPWFLISLLMLLMPFWVERFREKIVFSSKFKILWTYSSMKLKIRYRWTKNKKKLERVRITSINNVCLALVKCWNGLQVEYRRITFFNDGITMTS